MLISELIFSLGGYFLKMALRDSLGNSITHLKTIIQKPGAHLTFRKKSSRSEKAILGALGEFRGILGATPGLQKTISE